MNLGPYEGDWHFALYLQDNAVEHLFELSEAGTYQASFEFRGRWALKHVGAWIKYFLVEKLVQVHIENRPPVPMFTANPSEGLVNLTVHFDAGLSSDADQDALIYQWDFGDGTQGSGMTVDHTYSSTGIKTVTLTVNDGHGHIRSTSRTIQVFPSNATVTWLPVLTEFFDTTSDFYRQGNQQVRNGWTLWKNSGHNPLGNPNYDEPWNDWKTAEAKFRWSDHLSPTERALFLNEKGFCYRLLAGWSAWHAKLISPAMNLSPGTYRLRCCFYADVYTDVQADVKIPPQDPLSFEMRCDLSDIEGNWNNANVLGENIVEAVFQLSLNGEYAAGFEWRGRWAFRIVAAWIKWVMVERLQSAILVDNGRSGYSQTGSWATTTDGDYFDTPSVVSQTNGSSAQWRPTLPQSGLYKVFTRWTSNGQRSENALYTVFHQNGSQTIRCNQRLNRGLWMDLGTYQFTTGQSGYVTLTCEDTPVAADACLFLYSGGGGGSVTLTYHFPQADIYLISVPGQAANMSVASLFPNAEGGIALDYVNNDYQAVTVLETGKGYWLNILSPGQVQIVVTPISQFTRSLTAVSWHLLGSVITSQNVQSVQTVPSGAITTIFGYDPLRNSYYPAQFIEPQQGYWVGCLQNCQISVGGTGALAVMDGTLAYATAKCPELPPPPDVSHWRKVNAPDQFSVMPNFPNPFNPSTIITFSLPRAEKVDIKIYNALGQCVRQLLQQLREAGVHQVVWDGLDDEGRKAGTGIYFYHVRAGMESKVGKMVMLP